VSALEARGSGTQARAAAGPVARWRARIPALVHDTASTMAAEAVGLVGGLLFYALAARYFDPTGVGVIALVKRASGLLQPAVFLGLQTGLPRCIAAARAGSGGGGGAGPFLVAGSGILAAAVAVALGPILGLPGLTARVLLGGDGAAYLALPLALTLVSIVVYGAVRGYYFGFLRIPRANVVQVAAVAVAPVLALALWHPSPATALVGVALATTVVAAAGALPLVRHVWPARPRAVGSAAVELLRYSVPRMPGDLAIAGLVSAGTLWAARFADLHTAAYLSVSQSLLNAITAAFIPLSVVILPRAAALVASGDVDQIRSRLPALVKFTLVVSVFVTLQGMVFADAVLHWWLGPTYAAAAPLLRCVLAGVPFLALFFSLRGLVDAATATPYHTYNLFAALGVMIAGVVVSSLALPPDLRPLGVAASGSVAMAVLAVLTVRVCGRLYAVGLAIRGAGVPVLACAACGAAAVVVHGWLAGTTPLQLLAVLVLEAALAVLVALAAYGRELLGLLRASRAA